MLNKLRSKQGFTLIELLIVVAIIGILAAVAIPQILSYRMRGLNSAALSDLKNVAHAEESMFTVTGVYGNTVAPANLPAPGSAPSPGGIGTAVSGPQPAALPALVGAYLAGTDSNDTFAGIGYGVSSNVNILANTNSLTNPPATATGMSSTYTLFAKHVGGDTAYGSQLSGTGIFQTVSFANAGVALAGISGGAATALSAVPIPNTATIVNGANGWVTKP